ncbi:MAG: signal peptidase II [Candidatus Marinimicrobia bacterium]|nr:signal peptidase II [Candidatus Neomarinimicrobiota bacterium]|tara:strand:- start:15059 stop:15550 length:492 start_codon:yes stop_codon:yes gene_type:complete
MLQNKINIKKIDIYSFIIILIVFLLDRVSKIYVINLIQENQSEIFIYDFLNLTLNWNTGIAFGLLSFNADLLYHSISALILLIIIYLIYLMVVSDKFGKIIISLIIGGALGNVYDRLNYFAVPDFIDFHVEEFHWFTFNVADIFISIGITMILLREFFLKKKQ